jgi:hypothetical protein
MVPSISFSGRECRHADKIFAFPARTEFSVTTGVLAYNANYLPCEPQAGELWVERARIMPKERGYANYTRHAR